MLAQKYFERYILNEVIFNLSSTPHKELGTLETGFFLPTLCCLFVPPCEQGKIKL
jgi:hypothetical protein